MYPPKNGLIALWPNTCVVKCKIMFHKNKIVSIIRCIGTIFYSLVYVNSRIGFNGLKHLYQVISVIDNSIPGNTKKQGIAPFVDGQSAISPFLGGMNIIYDISWIYVLWVYMYVSWIHSWIHLHIFMNIFIDIFTYIHEYMYHEYNI